MVLFFVNNLFLLSYRLDFVGAQPSPSEADLKTGFHRFWGPCRIKTKSTNKISFPPEFFITSYWQTRKILKLLKILPISYEPRKTLRLTDDVPVEEHCHIRELRFQYCGPKMWLKLYIGTNVLLCFKRFWSQTCGYPSVREAARGWI